MHARAPGTGMHVRLYVHVSVGPRPVSKVGAADAFVCLRFRTMAGSRSCSPRGTTERQHKNTAAKAGEQKLALHRTVMAYERKTRVSCVVTESKGSAAFIYTRSALQQKDHEYLKHKNVTRFAQPAAVFAGLKVLVRSGAGRAS